MGLLYLEGKFDSRGGEKWKKVGKERSPVGRIRMEDRDGGLGRNGKAKRHSQDSFSRWFKTHVCVSLHRDYHTVSCSNMILVWFESWSWGTQSRGNCVGVPSICFIPHKLGTWRQFYSTAIAFFLRLAATGLSSRQNSTPPISSPTFFPASSSSYNPPSPPLLPIYFWNWVVIILFLSKI